MLSFLHKYAKNYLTSQNGEEGILLECQRRGIGIFHCVEIGGHDGRFCSNTAYVIESDIRAVTGLFVEADYDRYLQCKSNWAHNANVRCQCSRVDGNNVNAFVDGRCDLLSIDTDGSDYAIFCGLKARPKIVIVEIDSSIEPPSERVNSDGGVGYWTMTVAALERGYFVLCHTGNLVLVRQDYGHLFPECAPHPLLEWELYFNRSWLTGDKM
jgi:hypothetical protein